MGVVAGEDHGFVARFYARIPVRDDYAVVMHDRPDDRVARQADIAQILFGDLTALAGDIFDGFDIEAGQAGDRSDALMAHVALDCVDG